MNLTTAAIGIGVGALVGSGLVASRGVPTWEAEAFEACNDTPPIVTAVLWPPMQLGAGASPVLVAAAMAKLGVPYRTVVGVAVAGTGSYFAAKAVKRVIRRGRPTDHVATARVRPGGARGGLGFVSGHAAVAAAIVTTAAPTLPLLARWPAAALPVTVAVARVQNGSHLPLDVIGGMGLGLAIGGAWRAMAAALPPLVRR